MNKQVDVIIFTFKLCQLSLNAPRIEGAEFFETVYGYPFPNDAKPICYDETAVEDQSDKVTVADLRGHLISTVGVRFAVPAGLWVFQDPAPRAGPSGLRW